MLVVWWLLIGAVVLVYAYLGMWAMTAVFGPVRSAVDALSASVPP